MKHSRIQVFTDGAEPEWTNLSTRGGAARICLVSVRGKERLFHIVRNAASAGVGLFLCCGDAAYEIEDTADEILEGDGKLDVVTTAHAGEAAEDIADFIEVESRLLGAPNVLAFVDMEDRQSMEVCRILRSRWEHIGQLTAKSR